MNLLFSRKLKILNPQKGRKLTLKRVGNQPSKG